MAEVSKMSIRDRIRAMNSSLEKVEDDPPISSSIRVTVGTQESDSIVTSSPYNKKKVPNESPTNHLQLQSTPRHTRVVDIWRQRDGKPPLAVESRQETSDFITGLRNDVSMRENLPSTPKLKSDYMLHTQSPKSPLHQNSISNDLIKEKYMCDKNHVPSPLNRISKTTERSPRLASVVQLYKKEEETSLINTNDSFQQNHRSSKIEISPYHQEDPLSQQVQKESVPFADIMSKFERKTGPANGKRRIRTDSGSTTPLAEMKTSCHSEASSHGKQPKTPTELREKSQNLIESTNDFVENEANTVKSILKKNTPEKRWVIRNGIKKTFDGIDESRQNNPHWGNEIEGGQHTTETNWVGRNTVKKKLDSADVTLQIKHHWGIESERVEHEAYIPSENNDIGAPDVHYLQAKEALNHDQFHIVSKSFSSLTDADGETRKTQKKVEILRNKFGVKSNIKEVELHEGAMHVTSKVSLPIETRDPMENAFNFGATRREVNEAKSPKRVLRLADTARVSGGKDVCIQTKPEDANLQNKIDSSVLDKPWYSRIASTPTYGPKSILSGTVTIDSNLISEREQSNDIEESTMSVSTEESGVPAPTAVREFWKTKVSSAPPRSPRLSPGPATVLHRSATLMRITSPSIATEKEESTHDGRCVDSNHVIRTLMQQNISEAGSPLIAAHTSTGETEINDTNQKPESVEKIEKINDTNQKPESVEKINTSLKSNVLSNFEAATATFNLPAFHKPSPQVKASNSSIETQRSVANQLQEKGDSREIECSLPASSPEVRAPKDSIETQEGVEKLSEEKEDSKEIQGSLSSISLKSDESVLTDRLKMRSDQIPTVVSPTSFQHQNGNLGHHKILEQWRIAASKNTDSPIASDIGHLAVNENESLRIDSTYTSTTCSFENCSRSLSVDSLDNPSENEPVKPSAITPRRASLKLLPKAILDRQAKNEKQNASNEKMVSGELVPEIEANEVDFGSMISESHPDDNNAPSSGLESIDAKSGHDRNTGSVLENKRLPTSIKTVADGAIRKRSHLRLLDLAKMVQLHIDDAPSTPLLREPRSVALHKMKQDSTNGLRRSKSASARRRTETKTLNEQRSLSPVNDRDVKSSKSGIDEEYIARRASLWLKVQHPRLKVGDPSINLVNQKESDLAASNHSIKSYSSKSHATPQKRSSSFVGHSQNSNKQTRSRHNILSLTLSSAKFDTALKKKKSMTPRQLETTDAIIPPDPMENAVIAEKCANDVNECEYEQAIATGTATNAGTTVGVVEKTVDEKTDKSVIDQTNQTYSPIETFDSGYSSYDTFSTKRPGKNKKNLVMLGKKHLVKQMNERKETTSEIDVNSAEEQEALVPATLSQMANTSPPSTEISDLSEEVQRKKQLQVTADDCTSDINNDEKKEAIETKNDALAKVQTQTQTPPRQKSRLSPQQEEYNGAAATSSTVPDSTKSPKDKLSKQPKGSMSKKEWIAKQTLQRRIVGIAVVPRAERDINNSREKQPNAVDPEGIYFHKATPTSNKNKVELTTESMAAPHVRDKDDGVRNNSNQPQQPFEQKIETDPVSSAPRSSKKKLKQGDSPKVSQHNLVSSSHTLDPPKQKGLPVENNMDEKESRTKLDQPTKTYVESRPRPLLSPIHLHPAIASKTIEKVEPTSPTSFAGRAGALLRERRMQEEADKHDMILEAKLRNIREPQSPMNCYNETSFLSKNIDFQSNAFQKQLDNVTNNRAPEYTPSNPLMPSTRHVTSNTHNTVKTKGATNQPRLSKRYNRSSRFMDNDWATALASTIFDPIVATADVTSDVVLKSESIATAESSFISLESASTDSDIRLPADKEIIVENKGKRIVSKTLKTPPSIVSNEFMKEQTENVDHIHSICKNVTVTDLANDLVGEVNQVSEDLRNFATGFNDRIAAFRECVATTNTDSLYPKCKYLVPFDVEDVAIEVEYLDDDEEIDFVDDPVDDFGMCTSHVDRTVYQVDDAIRPSLACVDNPREVFSESYSASESDFDYSTYVRSD